MSRHDPVAHRRAHLGWIATHGPFPGCAPNSYRARSSFAAIAVVWLVLLGTAGSAQVFPPYSPQAAGKSSSLVTGQVIRQVRVGGRIRNVYDEITQAQFANMIQPLLIQNGNANAKDAKFLFQQCFGGGFLGAVQNVLGNTVPWIGGAASQWNQVSWGIEGPRPGDGWTSFPGTLVTQLANPNLTLRDAIGLSIQNDPFFRSGAETGQVLGNAAGNGIMLGDPAAASHHAILWAGLVNGNRFIADLINVRNDLMRQWAGTNFDITILAGSNNGLLPGSIAATRNNLQTTINNLMARMGPNEQFFFYASDHGDSDTTPVNLPRRIGGRRNDVEEIDLMPDELMGIDESPDSTPTLTIDYTGLTIASPVMFDGDLLGNLDPSLTEMTFDVPVSDITLDNTVEIDNAGTADFTVTNKTFDSGPIATFVIPEPGAGAAAGVGILIAALFLRSRKRM